MKQKKILVGALGCLIVCSQPAGMLAAANIPQAQSIESQAAGEMGPLPAGLAKSPEELAPDYNDPDYVKRMLQQENGEGDGTGIDGAAPFSLRSVSSKITESPFTGLLYTHAAQLSDSSIVHGIDVSKWQAEIDWEKVKSAGAEFVFIRCGYTSLSQKFAMYEDEYFRQNIQGAYDAGLKVGIYFFSNSKTVSEAKKEAEKTLELIDDYKYMITLPVVYDFEAFSDAYRAYGLSKAQVTKNLLAYAEILKEEGYTPMYYGSPNFLASSFDVPQLTEYDCWLANYTTQTAYAGDYSYWQYSSTGKIDGIAGNVDCNFFYSGSDEDQTDRDDIAENLGPVEGLWMTGNTTSSISIAWDPTEGAAGYKVYRSKAIGGTYKQLKVLTGNDVTEFTDSTVMESEGRQYYYKVVPYMIDEEAGEMKYGLESDILTAYTQRLHSFRLKTKANIHLREHAGTEYESVAVIPSGTGLPFYKFTLSTLDKKWYKVTYTQNGRAYTGYLSGSYADIYTYGNTTKKVNMRAGAGLSYKVQRAVPKGVKVTVVKNTKDSTGTKWSYVKYSQGGKNLAGYIPTKYIKQI